jgi:outer membrane beta-barrel protein
LALTLALLAPAAAARAQSGEEAEAGDVSEVDKDRLGPLRERIRPVSGHLFLKRGRFEFSPSATVSMRDAFFRKYVLGGTLTYHPWETVALSLRGGYALNTVSGSAQICNLGGDGERGCARPTLQELDGVGLGQITLLTGLDVQWAPIYGKISLLAEYFAHFDLYAVGGAAMVQYRAPAASGVGSQPEWTPGANVGVGLRFFLNRWVTLRTELRDVIYRERATLPDPALRNQLLFELGVSFFLPMSLPQP